MTDWQPISTIPADGTMVLVAWAHGDRKPDTGFSLPDGTLNLGWHHSPLVDAPTHWMPLPEPPGKEGRNDA